MAPISTKKVVQANVSPAHRTGTLYNITHHEVQALLGFTPFEDKGVCYWGFDYEGHPCVVWGKKNDTSKQFATQGREETLKQIFGSKYRNWVV